MSVWGWTGVAVGVALALYVAFVLALLMLGRKTDARAWAGFVPDCAILFARLVRDRRVARRHKLLLVLLVGYLSMPNKSHRYNLDARILVDLTWPGQGGLFQAFFKGNNSGDLLYGIDPLGAPSVTPEEVVLVGLSDGNAGIWVASHLAEHYRAGAAFNEDHRLIDHLHCRIEATVKSKTIDARVQTRFKALVDGARALPFDLYPTLRVKKVSDDQGQDLKFIQEKEDEDADFYVMLPQGLEKGQE